MGSAGLCASPGGEQGTSTAEPCRRKGEVMAVPPQAKHGKKKTNNMTERCSGIKPCSQSTLAVRLKNS